MGCVILSIGIRGGNSEKMTLNKVLKDVKKGASANIREESRPGRGQSKCKGSEAYLRTERRPVVPEQSEQMENNC